MANCGKNLNTKNIQNNRMTKGQERKIYIDRLLGDTKQYIKDKFQYDLPSTDYITHLNIAREIATKTNDIWLREFHIKDDKNHINDDDFAHKTPIVLDAFACIGGNTIAFAEKFKTIANELNKNRFMMLKNNLFLFSLDVELYNCDILDLINFNSLDQNKNLEKINTIFFDPPWAPILSPNGIEQKKLCVNDILFTDFIMDIFLRLKNIKLFIIKIPHDYEVDFIPDEIINDGSFDIDDYKQPNRMRIVYFWRFST